jgi:transposase
VRLEDAERKYAQNVLNSERTSTGYKKRANVLLMMDENAGRTASQAEIALRCGVSDVTVYHVAREFCEYGIEYALQFKKPKEPPRPPIVTGECEARIIALACGEPPQGYARWAVRLLTEKVVELSILPAASRETVRRTLKKLNLSLT